MKGGIEDAWQSTVRASKRADGDDVASFFGIDVGVAVIRAVNDELEKLRAVAEAAYDFDLALQWTPGHAFPARQKLRAALQALRGEQGEKEP